MNAIMEDGAAVAACRALLRKKRIRGEWNWRTTVVTRDGPEYVVRTWVHVPARRPRPEGTPDYVHVVIPSRQAGTRFRIEQVHPALS